MRRPTAGEFFPLPFYPFEERPHTLPLDVEEAATALFLQKGDVKAAAAKLRVMVSRLEREIRKSLRLQRLVEAMKEPEPIIGNISK